MRRPDRLCLRLKDHCSPLQGNNGTLKHKGKMRERKKLPWPLLWYISPFPSIIYVIGKPKTLHFQRNHSPLSAWWRLFSRQAKQSGMVVGVGWPLCLKVRNKTQFNWKVGSWLWGWAARQLPYAEAQIEWIFLFTWSKWKEGKGSLNIKHYWEG